MTRILAMHQPNFLPWLGFFDKMAQADVFVLLDNAQVSNSRSYASRTKIKVSGGVMWLSLPIKRDRTYTYRDQLLFYPRTFLDEALKKLNHSYARAPYADPAGLISRAHQALSVGRRRLADFNTWLIIHLADKLEVSRSAVILQSHFTLDRHYSRRELPIELCKLFLCDVYLSGTGARAYNDEELFAAAGVELRYQDFTCPEYHQLYPPFIPNLSAIDLVFNEGPRAADIFRTGRKS